MDKNAKYSTLSDEQIASLQKENRHIEFKSNYQDPDRLGQYFSALSNGACLDGKDFGYLYFGVQDETLEIIGQLFTIPFLKTTTELMLKIRNYRIKIYPHNSLIPAEIWKYDTRSILEGLHNCIAHQDYTKDERILVTEDKEKLTFENAGCFYEGDYEQYILGEKTPKKYRNPFLVKAMLNVKMIDSQGFGIHNMYMRQKRDIFQCLIMKEPMNHMS